MSTWICACGRKYESDKQFAELAGWANLFADGHNPDDCSRRIGYQDRLDGRAEMIVAIRKELIARRTLGGAEIAELTGNLREAALRIRPVSRYDDFVGMREV